LQTIRTLQNFGYNFRLCNINKPATLTSLVSSDRKPIKECNLPLRNAASLLQSTINTNGAMEAYTHKKQNPSKTLHCVSKVKHTI
jgi:hypothetical protein